ncbi:MAG: polyprenyl synthetase family protein [Anaerolineae bacterium]
MSEGMVFENLDEYLNAIELEMRNSMAVSEKALAPYYGMISYHLGWVDERFVPTEQETGKRLRPLLCVLACEACGGDWRRAVPAAAAIELMHNFSLIHDDIEDNSPQRRHRPTVWSLWGQAQAINVGDGLFAISRLALQRLANRGISPQKVVVAFRIVDQTCLYLTEGQYLDLAFEEVDGVTVDMYLEMIGKKTGALMSCATQLGALLGTDDERVMESYGAFGYELGLLFQIVDDMLGIWGAGEATGKGVGEDIVSRKKSLPILYALQRSDELRRIYRRERMDAAQQEVVMERLESLSAREYAREMAIKHLRLAVHTLEDTGVRNRAQEDLRSIAHFLLDRRH